MSILIKNMTLPKNCAECEWHEYYGGDYDWVHACRRTGTMPIENAETERANDCPLVEIPVPHRRLIDVDDFMRHLINNVSDLRTLSPSVVCNALRDTPTIIEAEGEG